jgi:hypothetical protein
VAAKRGQIPDSKETLMACCDNVQWASAPVTMALEAIHGLSSISCEISNSK